MSDKERILIVDDDINVSKSLALIFGKKGYETEMAFTGRDAIEMAKGRAFNIALLDINLPDMEGIELIAPLKKMHPDMAVIMVTGYASVDNAVRALNEGAAAYNTKPLNMDEVLVTIENVAEKQHLIFEKRQAEEALQESQEMLNSFMESATDIFILLDSKLDIIEINNAGLKTWVVNKKKVIGKNLLEISPGLNKTGRYDQYLDVIKTGQPFFNDDIVPDPKFGNKHLSVKAFKVGEGLGMIITDITERKRAEEKLRRSEENYRTLFNMSPEAILWIDSNGIILDCNEATTALVKRQKREIVGNSFKNLEFLNGNSNDSSKKRQVMIKRGDYVKSGLIEYKLGSKGNNNRWLEIFPALLKRGEEDYALQAVIRDITDRKNAEEALQRSQESLKEAQRIAHLGNLDWNITNNTLWWSDEIYRIFKLTPQEFDVSYNAFLNMVHPGDRKFVEDSVNKALNDNQAYVIDHRIILPDGSERLVHEQGEVFFDNDGKPIRMVGTVQDITDRKKADDQIKASLEEKEVLLKEIHHRVKNNMQVISSMLNLQFRDIKDERILDIFRDSQNRIRSMALVHEGLYQSRDLASVNFEGYIKRLTGQLLNSRGISSANIRLNLNVREIFLDITAAIPCGLIINELVSNALKHAFPDGETGEIQIELTTEREHEIILTIKDNGIGFPEDLDFRNTRSLGLQLVNTLVKQVNGTIELGKDHGTAFTIKFEKTSYSNGEKMK